MAGMDTPNPYPNPYRFHHYQLLPAQRQLLNGEHIVKLGSRAFDMLVALVERRDRVVPKHELMDLVWPKLVVEENNLQVQVLALRKLLGHGAIATIPGRGYRFTLPVEGAAQALPPDSPPAAATGPALIGREDELRVLQGLLLAHPLVTISGAGGIGKTRLAQAAAQGVKPPQELAWVDLVGLNDASTLPAAVAQALGIELTGAADARVALATALRGRSALLVLDNAEHLLDAVAAFVATLRDQASTLRVLVTSQEVLRLSDEQVFRPGPLALPATDDLLSVRASAAVELFVARARQVDRRFDLGEHNHAAVAEVCRRLDGIPLAIELAAARVALLGVEGVRDRLDERFELLTAGARAAMRRHQTLRAALEWSHGLLTPDEQRVLRRLGVLAGGFTLEAAQEVAKDEAKDEAEGEAEHQALDGWDVLERLGALVDKSLVVAEGDSLPRYRLLETTRMFALERLAEAGETEATLLRHARCFMALARRCDAEIAAQGQGAAALARLDPERDNLLHALRWCERGAGRGTEVTEVGLQLFAALRYYWSSRGLLPVGAAQALRSLAAAKALPVTPARLQALASAVQLHSWMGQAADAARLALELLAAARDVDSAEHESRAMVMLGHQAADADRLAEAEDWMQQGLALARRQDLQRHESAALNGLIAIATVRGDHALAHQLGQQTLALSRAAGQGYNLCTNLLNVAIAALEAGQPAHSREHLLEAAPLVPGTGSRFLKLLWLMCALPLLPGSATWPDVVRLYAAGAAHEQSLQVAQQDQLERHKARHLAAARAAMGDTAFDAAWSEGETLDLDTAREQVLALLH